MSCFEHLIAVPERVSLKSTGFRGTVARSTLADANEAHDWRIYVIELALDRTQASLDAAEALAVGELSETQTQILISAGESACGCSVVGRALRDLARLDPENHSNRNYR